MRAWEGGRWGSVGTCGPPLPNGATVHAGNRIDKEIPERMRFRLFAL